MGMRLPGTVCRLVNPDVLVESAPDPFTFLKSFDRASIGCFENFIKFKLWWLWSTTQYFDNSRL